MVPSERSNPHQRQPCKTLLTENSKCVFCHHEDTIKHSHFPYKFVRSIWSVIQVGSTLYPLISVANILDIWLNGVDYRFKIFIRVRELAFIWLLWLCENGKVFNDKKYSLLDVIYLCTASLHLWRLYNVWRIVTCLWRCLYGWRTHREIFLPRMGPPST
jgi:hypothetical protein